MGMSFEVNRTIITEGKEEKLQRANHYQLIKDGYNLYPLNGELLELQKHKGSIPAGLAEVKEITWKENQTTIIYELKKLGIQNFWRR